MANQLEVTAINAIIGLKKRGWSHRRSWAKPSKPGPSPSGIHRRQIVPAYGPHLEVGFSSMERPVDYFLWIIVPLERATDIVEGLPVRS